MPTSLRRLANIPLIDDTEDGSKGSGLMPHKLLVIDQTTVKPYRQRQFHQFWPSMEMRAGRPVVAISITCCASTAPNLLVFRQPNSPRCGVMAPEAAPQSLRSRQR